MKYNWSAFILGFALAIGATFPNSSSAQNQIGMPSDYSKEIEKQVGHQLEWSNNKRNAFNSLVAKAIARHAALAHCKDAKDPKVIKKCQELHRQKIEYDPKDFQKQSRK